jgi:eukaryotic-like serine/threonine-protein kinase
MTSTAGRIIGNYELGEPIGRGGAGEVFAGVHRTLGHEVAVKLLRGDPGGIATAVDEFLGEASRARAVHHPNLVAVLDFGRDEASGRCYVVMERIPGESLAERLRRVGRMQEAEVRALGAALADGMQAAHDGGIVHRDLKPANVMLRGDEPTVVDFGLARDLGGRSAVETDRRVGTPAYMAPEQLTGGLIAPCVDVWALGVILFEALAGRLPFEGFADGRCPQLFETAPRLASLVAVSPELDALVAGCLERAPGRRPASMAAVARSLRGEGDERVTRDVGDPREAGAPFVATVASSSVRPRSRRMLLGAAAIGGAAVLVLVLLVATRDPGPGVGAPDRSIETASIAPAPGTSTPAPSPAPVETNPAPAEPGADPAGLDVEVHSTPSGAEVIVGGERRGRTPTRLHMAEPGSILVRKRGYEPARVRVERGGLVDVRLSRRARAARSARDRPRESERREGLD